MIDQIPTGFQGFIYDRADRERRLEAKKWEKEIHDFRYAADCFGKGEAWGRQYLLPWPSSNACRNLPRDLQDRMEYVYDSLELEEFGAADEAIKVLREAADTLEAIMRQRFGLAGFAEAAE